MQNITPNNGGKILLLLMKAYAGVVRIGTAVGVTMVTAAQLLAGKTAFKNAEDTFNTSRKALRDGYLEFKPAMKSLTAWLGVVRTTLAGPLGQRWSAAWAEAGFINNTTSVPKDNAARIALGLALVTFLTNHPEYEVPNSGVTAAKGSELTDAALAGQTAVATAEEALKTAGDVRESARKNALDLISTLIANLNKKLAPDDPRWLAFGLEMPATPATPSAPQNVTVSLADDGSILVQWDATPQATRYRGRMMILGVDTKYRLVFSGTEPMGMIGGVQPGVTVQIVVQAVNGSAQGVASEPVIFTVPVAQVDAAAAELAPSAATSPNGNSSSNGSSKTNGTGSQVFPRVS